jgi:hypothetical protein
MGEAIEPDNDQGLATANVSEQPCRHRAAAVGAGGMLFQYFSAAGSPPLLSGA